MKELEPINVVNLNTIIQLIMKKRFLITILLMLVLAVAAQAQEKKGFDWKKMTVGTEFVHNITKGYYFGNNSILLDHPNNSVDIRVMYDHGRYWTLGVYGGFRLCRRTLVSEEEVPAGDYRIRLNRSIYVNEPQAMFGIEADLHLLPLIGADSPWYDIYAIGRIGSTMHTAMSAPGRQDFPTVFSMCRNSASRCVPASVSDFNSHLIITKLKGCARHVQGIM